MRILFDQGTPAPLRRHLGDHTVDTVGERGWPELGNGDLIARAEDEGYDVLVTTDQKMRYQQNLTGRRLAIVVLLSTAWPYVRLHTDEIRLALNEVRPGEFREVPIRGGLSPERSARLAPTPNERPGLLPTLERGPPVRMPSLGTS